jgi:predicted GNAT family acetyltransferase
MELARFEDVAAFYRQAEPFLLAHEAEHNLMLGLCATLVQNPGEYESAPYLAVVTEGETTLAAALRTPPHNLILSLIPEEADAVTALDLIARDTHALYGALPGVIGPSAMSGAFATRWQALTGQPYHVGMQERIYRLDTVIPVAGVPGRFRRATEADRALLVRWLPAFHREALGEREPLDAERWLDNALASPVRGVYLWEDGGAAVALAAHGGHTPHSMRVGPVYTPPEERRKGYASACVAALSQQLLDEGCRFCTLFTDLSNPTSNHIYQAVGYQPVCDVDVYEIDLSAGTGEAK